MKNSLSKFKYLTGLAMIAFLLPGMLIAQQEISKTISKEWTLNSDAIIDVKHYRGPLKILKSTSNQARMEAIIRVKAKDEEAAKKLMDKIEIEDESTGNSLKITTNSNIREVNINNSRSRIVFKDGERLQLSGRIEYEVEMNLSVPASRKLILNNRYDDIHLEQMDAEVEVTLYSGDLIGSDINGNLKLNLKYGSAHLGSANEVTFDIYDSKLDIENVSNLNLKSKYSKCELGDVGEAIINSYDDDMVLGEIKGDLELTGKYGSYEFKDFENAEIDIYDSDIRASNGKNVDLKSKYSTIRFANIDDLKFESSYDDEVEVEEINSMVVVAKYTEFYFEKVRSKLDINSYDGVVKVDALLSSFNSFSLESKYDDIILNVPSGFGFELDSEIKYGTVKFPSGTLDVVLDREQSGTQFLKGKSKGASGQLASFFIRAYDTNVRIN